MFQPGTLRGFAPARQVNQHPVMGRRPGKQRPEGSPGSRGAVKVDIRCAGRRRRASGALLHTHRAGTQLRGKDLPPQRGRSRGGAFLLNTHGHLLLVVSKTDSEPHGHRTGPAGSSPEPRTAAARGNPVRRQRPRVDRRPAPRPSYHPAAIWTPPRHGVDTTRAAHGRRPRGGGHRPQPGDGHPSHRRRRGMLAVKLVSLTPPRRKRRCRPPSSGSACRAGVLHRRRRRQVRTRGLDRVADSPMSHRSASARCSSNPASSVPGDGHRLAGDEWPAGRRDPDTVERFGRLDVLVNHPSLVLLGQVVGADPEEWERIIAINVQGLLHATGTAPPHLLQSAENGPGGLPAMVLGADVPGRKAVSRETRQGGHARACVPGSSQHLIIPVG